MKDVNLMGSEIIIGIILMAGGILLFSLREALTGNERTDEIPTKERKNSIMIAGLGIAFIGLIMILKSIF